MKRFYRPIITSPANTTGILSVYWQRFTGIVLYNRWNCNEYCDTFHEDGLSHLLTQPTHELGNTLDFILVTCLEYFTEISVEQDLFTSDQYLVNFWIIFDLHKSHKSARPGYNITKLIGLALSNPSKIQIGVLL